MVRRKSRQSIGHTCAFIVFLERGEMAPTAEGLDSEGSDTGREREEEKRGGG